MEHNFTHIQFSSDLQRFTCLLAPLNMNSHLRMKILNKLQNNLYEEELQSNCSLLDEQDSDDSCSLDLTDTAAVLELIDRRVEPLSKIWSDIRVGVERARHQTDAKDVAQAEVALAEGKFRLQKLLLLPLDQSSQVADEEEQGKLKRGSLKKKKKKNRKSEEELTAILELADEAVLHCPTSAGQLLGTMYAFRADVLELAGQPEAALVNIERANALVMPTEMIYVLKKVRLLLATESVHLKAVADYVKEISLVDSEVVEQQQISAKIKRLWKTLLGRLEAASSQTEDDDIEEVAHQEVMQSRCTLKEPEPSNPIRGRSLIASQDLPPGTTVLTEPVTSLVLQPSQRLRRCALCSRPASRTFRPCSHCLSAVYCSDQCAKNHSNNHSFECGLLKMLTGLRMAEFKKKDIPNGLLNLLHVYRQLVDAGAEALLKASEEEEKEKSSLESMHQLSLLQHHQQLNRQEASLELVGALQVAIIFLIASGYEYEQVSFSQLAALTRLALLNGRRVSTNALSWTEYDDQQDPTGRKVQVGSVLALRSSLLNHSCLANAEWSPLFLAEDEGYGSLKMQVRISTTKRVAAGEELTINYLASLQQQSFSSFVDVRNLLQAQYHFTCNCGRCLELLSQQQMNSELPLPLQCSHCPGPVLQGELNFSEEDILAGTGQCLLCHSLVPGAREQAKKAGRAREALHLIARLIDGVVEGEKRQFYLEKMADALHLVISCVYRKCHFLLEDIYAVCKVLHRELEEQPQFEECLLLYGRLVDKLLPLDGPKLLALGKTAGEQLLVSSITTNAVFDVDIEHLLFWADGVFGTKKKSVWKVVGEEEEDDSWQLITGARFAYRLEKALQAVIAQKTRRLLPAGLLEHSCQDFASLVLQEELKQLKALAKEKKIVVQ